MINTFFFTFLWLFVYHMMLLAAASYDKALLNAFSGFCCHLAHII
jgi:hypothetical protein